MVNLKDEYIVVADGFIKFRGNFRACQKWCTDIKWVLIIVKVVADGKEI